MYWTDLDCGRIFRSNLDGQNVEYDYIRSGSPRDIVLDVDRGKIYWTGWMDAGTIQRADLNGENIEVLITGLNRPEGIALLNRDKLYWTDEGTGEEYWVASETGKIQAADLDGSNVKDALTGLSYPKGIALDAVRRKLTGRTPTRT